MTLIKGKYFILFSNCIPVQGAKRSIICDLQRGLYYHIPHSFVIFFEELSKNPISEFLSSFEKNDRTIAESYIEFAEKHDLGFFCDNPENFPDISLEFNSPFLLNDLIIEYSSEVLKHNVRLLKDFVESGLQFIEFRIVEKDFEITKEFINKLNRTRVRGVTLLISSDNTRFCENIHELIISNPYINNVLIHSVNRSKMKKYINLKSDKVFVTDKIITSNSCGVIDADFFVTSLPFYLESLSFNNCLNRKLSIDKFGEIKSCPSLKVNLGNIRNTSLIDALQRKEYKELSSITKAQIKVCKDCEYRMICSDCRAYLDNIYDKPSKCNYDPYSD